MYRQAVKLFFLALVFMGIGFLLGRLFFPENGGMQEKKLFGNAPKYNLSAAKFDDLPFLFEDMYVGEPPPGLEDIQFPSMVDGLLMDKLVTGEEAMEYARKIHGEDAPIERVFISYYCGNHEQVILWLFEFSSSEEAKKHMEKVSGQIKNSHILTEYGYFYLQNVEVNYVQGLMQNNYYYNKDRIIYWVSLFNKDPIPLFLEFYEYF